MTDFDTSAAPRKGDWIQTYSSKQFWPLDPRADEFTLEDVAAGVANECRFAGQCRPFQFYSVAEHSVLMTHFAIWQGLPPRVLRAVLFHDASEGLGLRDMARPIKRTPEFSGYRLIEGRVMSVVAAKFDFDWPLDPRVKEIDERIGLTEEMALMGPKPAPWNTNFKAIEPLPVTINRWSPEEAFEAFLAMAATLGIAR